MIISAAIFLILLFSFVILKFSKSNLNFLFYILSGVVSLVGINVKLGITLYLSRLFIILFLAGRFIRIISPGSAIRLTINKTSASFAILFALILFQHSISVLFSDRVTDGIRQILYMPLVWSCF